MKTSIHLRDIVQSVPGVVSYSGVDRLITGIKIDSRDIEPGDIFVALKGLSNDGHDYIDQALQSGAAAILGTKPINELPLPIPYIHVEAGRLALAYLSAAFYGFPARKLVMIGITGTDGKTTTANLIFNILKKAGINVGMITTVNVRYGDVSLETGYHVTTPEAPAVQNFLSRMVDSGITHVILEATSHGLAQKRVEACDFDIGLVTNITHEHLDYHGSFEDYRKSKASLFSGLSESSNKEVTDIKGAVLNFDDGSYRYLSHVTKVPQISYGFSENAIVRGRDIRQTNGGLGFISDLLRPNQFRATGPAESFSVISKLIGDYNVLNCLASIAVTSEILQINSRYIVDGIFSLKSIPGRLEFIDMGQNFYSVVDFAHTPNALRNALKTARKFIRGKESGGRLIAIYGSAGLRDREKRQLMAHISGEEADVTIFTAEDPRTESLKQILDEMVVGIRSTGGEEGVNFWRIPDRREAIRFGVNMAQAGDLVMVCGKGHEQSMCFGDIEYVWDDRVALRSALAERLGLRGPEMPFLPDWK
jgi:UDP-N-acetylmuramoyl-L-alanyl-D-glutamate--2,6-diaminopimelate ligase